MKLLVSLLYCLFLTTACSHGPQKSIQSVRNGQVIEGKASFYADFFHGRKTASGDIYSRNLLTAAHNKLPFGTRIKVTNKRNGKSVVVKINDRGGFTKVDIDLSWEAARRIGMLKEGIARVFLEIEKR